MANKKDGMTIEDLAGIIKGVAKTTDKSIEDLAGMIERNLPTKEDIKKLRLELDGKINSVKSELKLEIKEVRNGLGEVKVELEEVHEIVKRIDEKDLPNLKRRVTTLETTVKTLTK